MGQETRPAAKLPTLLSAGFRMMISSALRFLVATLIIGVSTQICIAQDAPVLSWFRSDVQEGTASAFYRWAVDGAVANS